LNQPPGRWPADRWSRPLAFVLCTYALVGGVISFMGWALDIPILTDWDADGISIQPNATVAVMLASAAVLLLVNGMHAGASTLGVIVALIGGATIFEYVAGISLGIDEALMFGREWGRVGVLAPGRMGPPGSVAWTVLGSALVMASSHRERLRAAAPILALASGSIASLSLTGYFYGASTLYTIPTVTVIAFQTSTFLLTISIAVILSVRDYGPMKLLGDPGPAGTLARRILPGVVILPILLGFIVLAGARAGLFDVAFGTAARTLAEVSLFVLLLWWTARAIRRHSEAQSQAEAALAARERDLRSTLDSLMQSRDVLEAELADSQALQELSTELIRQDDVDALHRRVLETAMRLAKSQCASMQILDTDPVTGARGLRLLVEIGFNERAKAFWQWVDVESHSSCGRALQVNGRVEVPDVLEAAWMAGTEQLEVSLGTGIRAVQTTPMVSRTGALLGMLSTHWAEPHTSSERERRLIDILVRQAADIIDRRLHEDALREADRRKDVFLMTLAHELRNPLAPIRSAVDVLKTMPASAPGLVRVQEIIERQTSVMARLLDDLLDVGRIVRDRLELRWDHVPLESAIRSGLEMSTPLVERFRHQLDVDLPEESITVRGDHVRLAQVVGNLINNACRYTEPGGRLSVKLERQEGEAVITVADSGIGIPREKLATIFDIFSQIDTSLERSQGGLGIGLYLVRRLVDLHSGRVEVRSAGLGKGSTFIVHLPVLEPAAGLDAPLSAGKSGSRERGKRVLVVDDNTDAAELLSTILESADHETAMAHDGVDALALADSFRPDVVLLDIGLPQLNGYEVCKQLRTRTWGQHLMLIAVTGWGQDSDRLRSRDAGFDHHLVKPIDHEKLLALLDAAPVRRADSASV
jgi:signal transduction histidine kinase/CheY-like chemotaxis protein